MSRDLRIVLWATAGFLVLQAGWMLVLPPFTGSDEFDHANRAISVADGHWYNRPDLPPAILGRGDLIISRADIVAAANPACSRLRYTGPFNCRPQRELSGNEVVVASAAARYNPVYYALVGFAAQPFHGNAALYVMRLVSALGCAALFALSVWLTTRWARSPWPTVALVLSALPTTVYSSAVAAPNGLEMMSGLTLWAALTHLTRAPGRSLPAYAALGLSAALLVNAHTLGAFWLALTIVSVAVLVGVRSALARLWPHSPGEWAVALASGAAIGFGVVWVRAARTNDPSDFPVVLKNSVWPALPHEMALWPLQAIGAFPLRDQPAPVLVYAIAGPLLLALMFIAIRAVVTSRDGATGMTLIFVTVASFVLPALLTSASYSRFGLTWQGRYGMPFTVGLILLYGMALDRAGIELPHVILNVGIAAWLVVECVSQLGVLDEQRADATLVRATGWWAPPSALLVVLGVIAAWAWRRAVAESPRAQVAPSRPKELVRA